MGKVINCPKKVIDDFQEHYNALYNYKKHYEAIEKGQYLPANINDLIKHSDKICKLLTKIKDTATELKHQ